jgi:AcrR family transcriptional regulator
MPAGIRHTYGALDRAQVVAGLHNLTRRVGVQRVTMRELAAELGVAVPSVYYHVPGKQAALDLLAESLQYPSFPATELDTLKRAQTAGLEQERTDPRAVAVRALARYDNPYPKGDDRYTATFDEELAEIRAPGIDRLQDFHRSFYGASAAEISVVGDSTSPL